LAELKHLGAIATDLNYVHREVKSGLHFGNAYYHSVKNNFIFPFPSPKNLKIKIYKTVILTVTLDSYETLAFALREEQRGRMCQNRMLWRAFGSKRE
jgi:hypothetical protein